MRAKGCCGSRFSTPSRLGDEAPGSLSKGHRVKWSVGIETQGDRLLSREEIVELADAVAPSSGVASGIGTNRYGATLIVEARSRD